MFVFLNTHNSWHTSRRACKRRRSWRCGMLFMCHILVQIWETPDFRAGVLFSKARQNTSSLYICSLCRTRKLTIAVMEPLGGAGVWLVLVSKNFQLKSAILFSWSWSYVPNMLRSAFTFLFCYVTYVYRWAVTWILRYAQSHHRNMPRKQKGKFHCSGPYNRALVSSTRY